MHGWWRVSNIWFPRAIVVERGACRRPVIREHVEVVVLCRCGVRFDGPRAFDNYDNRRRVPGEELAQEDVRRRDPQILEPTLAIDGLVRVGIIYSVIPENDAHVRHGHIQARRERRGDAAGARPRDGEVVDADSCVALSVAGRPRRESRWPRTLGRAAAARAFGHGPSERRNFERWAAGGGRTSQLLEAAGPRASLPRERAAGPVEVLDEGLIVVGRGDSAVRIVGSGDSRPIATRTVRAERSFSCCCCAPHPCPQAHITPSYGLDQKGLRFHASGAAIV
mmetsp:Transcript_13105/g.40248  ORF Transcript_13105/g.40248 Transcript_13105/m.40248 type:complete len:280 (+) Transcript_13105:947-1786(+)